jgi:hypothetical protein
MKTAGSEKQNRRATMRSKPSTWSGRLEQLMLNRAGWKARKPPAQGEVFFLTCPSIELIQALELNHGKFDVGIRRTQRVVKKHLSLKFRMGMLSCLFRM